MLVDLISAARNAGIVGAGGAGFPTYVKLDAKADTVIVNGAECEPLLRVDQQLMAHRPGDLLRSLEMIVTEVGAARGVVALKSYYHDAVTALKAELPKYPKLSIFEMGSFYPAGDEQVLVTEVTGRIVPEAGIPLNVGVVVCNVETALNLYDAAVGSVPVTEKLLTLTGAVVSPKTVRVPLGITVREAIDLAGGVAVPSFEVINGGPMMGKIVGLDTVVTKTTKGLIVLPTGHSLLASLNQPLGRTVHDAKIACMQCSMCSEVCPRSNIGHGLYPHKLMRMAAYGSMLEKDATPMSANLCSGCRLCEYACVMRLQPWKLNGNLKGVMKQNGIKNTLTAKPEATSKFRETKRYPLTKLIAQLGLSEYNRAAPLDNELKGFEKVQIPLQQGFGAPSVPTVSVGDRVAKGDLIAAIPEGALGSNLHASISGTIRGVTKEVIEVEA